MPDKAKRYTVKGIDDLGDVHIFCTDDHRRATEVEKQMREDLGKVERTENAS